MTQEQKGNTIDFGTLIKITAKVCPGVSLKPFLMLVGMIQPFSQNMISIQVLEIAGRGFTRIKLQTCVTV